MPKLIKEIKHSVPRMRNVMIYTFASPTKSSGFRQVNANITTAGMPMISIFGIYDFRLMRPTGSKNVEKSFAKGPFACAFSSASTAA